MQYFGYSVNIIFVIVALLLFQRIFLFHVQFVNGMNTSYVQIRNELASEQLIKVQFQVAMSGRYISFDQHNAQTLKNRNIFHFRVDFFFINSYGIILVTENNSYEMAIVCQNYNFAFISLDQ